jgi:hypothetical protein
MTATSFLYLFYWIIFGSIFKNPPSKISKKLDKNAVFNSRFIDIANAQKSKAIWNCPLVANSSVFDYYYIWYI